MSARPRKGSMSSPSRSRQAMLLQRKSRRRRSSSTGSMGSALTQMSLWPPRPSGRGPVRAGQGDVVGAAAAGELDHPEAAADQVDLAAGSQRGRDVVDRPPGHEQVHFVRLDPPQDVAHEAAHGVDVGAEQPGEQGPVGEVGLGVRHGGFGPRVLYMRRDNRSGVNQAGPPYCFTLPIHVDWSLFSNARLPRNEDVQALRGARPRPPAGPPGGLRRRAA